MFFYDGPFTRACENRLLVRLAVGGRVHAITMQHGILGALGVVCMAILKASGGSVGIPLGVWCRELLGLGVARKGHTATSKMASISHRLGNVSNPYPTTLVGTIAPTCGFKRLRSLSDTTHQPAGHSTKGEGAHPHKTECYNGGAVGSVAEVFFHTPLEPKGVDWGEHQCTDSGCHGNGTHTRQNRIGENSVTVGDGAGRKPVGSPSAIHKIPPPLTYRKPRGLYELN